MSKAKHNRPKKRKGLRGQRKQAQTAKPSQAADTHAVAGSHPLDHGPSTIISLDPLAPLIIRSGRPYDGQAGVDPARFPPPSTTAGCLRSCVCFRQPCVPAVILGRMIYR